MKIAPYHEPKVHIEDNELTRRAIRMSNRQFCQLQAFANERNGQMGLEHIAFMNQTTLGGCRRRRWVAERGKRAVGLTMEGRQVLRAFMNADFTRKIASTNFSSYFSLEVPEELTEALKQTAKLQHQKEMELAGREAKKAKRESGVHVVKKGKAA